MKRFIHIPKNAGTSVVKWLDNNDIKFLYGNGWKRVGIHRTAHEYLNEESEKFCIVRNPYTRTISYFNYLSPGENWRCSFEDFVKNKLSNVKTKIPNAWNPQVNWIYKNGSLIVDKVIRYENIENEIQDYFKLSTPFLKSNVSTLGGYDMYYTDETKEIVYQHFKQDFDLLNYKK